MAPVAGSAGRSEAAEALSESHRSLSYAKQLLSKFNFSKGNEKKKL